MNDRRTTVKHTSVPVEDTAETIKKLTRSVVDFIVTRNTRTTLRETDVLAWSSLSVYLAVPGNGLRLDRAQERINNVA